MHWKIKAFVQKAAAAAPPGFANALYYWLQRRFGGLRRPTPAKHYAKAAALARALREAGRPVAGRRLVEIGTGRTLNVPLGLWLCGAESVATFDLNRYLKPALVEAALDWTRRHLPETRTLLADACDPDLLTERLETLADVEGGLEKLMAVANIAYRAPTDAARLPLADGAADIHYSMDTLEHIPLRTLHAIFCEARRILAPGGVLAHFVDPSDHFAHGDPSITAIHFLRFSEKRWHFWAGNRFMHHNRLRASDYRRLLAELGARTLWQETKTDQASLDALARDFPLDPRFRQMNPEDLATTRFHFVAELDVSDRVDSRRRLSG